METQLEQIIQVQAKQNQLLKNQLRWLTVGLLVMVAVSICSLGVLIHERGKVTVVTMEPIIEHPISLGEDETNQIQFASHSLTENDATHIQFGNRITPPPMGNASPIQFDFPKVVSDAELRPGRGCDGMCF
jgi:hypothetical protein